MPHTPRMEGNDLITQGLMTIATPKITHLTSFYSQVLDCNPVVVQPHQYVEYQLPSLRLGLFQPKADQQAEFFASASPGRMSLCLYVHDLQGAIARLTDLGYAPQTIVQVTSHGSELYLYDPDGNRVILYQPLTVGLS